jgi:hypothetical protein
VSAAFVGALYNQATCTVRVEHLFPFATCYDLFGKPTTLLLYLPIAFLFVPIEIIRLYVIRGHLVDLVFGAPFVAIHIAGWSYAVVKFVRLANSAKVA